MRVVLIILTILGASMQLSAQVILNEVMSDNSLFLDAELDSTPDWVELFNPSKETVDLSGWSISDDSDNLTKWTFEDISIASGEYLLLIANGDTHIESSPFFQLNFKLGKGGESIFLTNELEEIVDQTDFPCMPKNRSFGRKLDGTSSLYYVPTPGEANAESTIFEIEQNELHFSHEAGLYETSFSLEVSDELGESIYYTTDGSIPDESSLVVTTSFLIQEDYKNDGLSYIPTSLDWEQPQTPVYSGYTYKFVSYTSGCPSSVVETQDYFVRPLIHERYSLPVFSISFDEDDLFGDYGIMVGGITGDNYIHKGEEWERRGHLRVFHPEESSIINQPIDMRIRGRGSRKNRQKSLRLYARDEHGKSTFDYPLFDDREISSYKRLALRSGHSDFTKTLVKDLLSADLVESLDVEYMESETAIVFMNGEYWGIQNARENQDKYYLESHFGVNPDSVTILKFEVDNLIANEGTTDDFQELLDFAATNDLGDAENFDYLASRIDIANFIEYHIAELYFANWDWPQNNNRVWRSSEEDSKYRWMFYDCDGCFYRGALDRITALNNPKQEVLSSFTLLKNALANEGFRSTFYARYLELMSTEFSSDRIIEKLDSIETLYEPLIIEHIKRWSTPESYFSWKENLSEMRVFALQRPYYVMKQLNALFDFPVTIYPNPTNDFFRIDVDTSLPLELTILNQYGGVVLQEHAFTHELVDVSGLSSGLYIVKIQMGSLSFTEKLIKN